jgi:hypothetical protein
MSINYILYKLSKKASRKNLEKYILTSFNKIKKETNTIKVLNIGAGGDLGNLISSHFNNIYSIDIDDSRKPDQLLDLCDEHFTENLKYKPNLICCFEVLEHTNNPVKAINNIYNILEKNDYCLLSVPFNFHIHDEPFDYYRFTFYGLKKLFKNFSDVKILRRNGWLESIFINMIRLEKENNLLSKYLGKIFILLYYLLLPLILIIQKIFPSEKLTTGYYVEAKK